MGGMFAKARGEFIAKALKKAMDEQQVQQAMPQAAALALEDEDKPKKKKAAGLKGKTKRTGGAGKFGETILG
jgi:hypothetical protein